MHRLWFSAFEITGDSSIVNGDTICLKDIKALRTHMQNQGVIGSMIIGSGVATSVAGLILAEAISNGSGYFSGLVAFVVGVPVVFVGIIVITSGVLVFIIDQKYSKKNWNYSLRTPEKGAEY